jgi:hypothetical protein
MPRSDSDVVSPPRGEPVDRFHPTSGVFLGWLCIAVGVAIVVYLVVNAQTVLGLRIGLACLLAVAVVWATLLRPRAVAYADRLVLRNSVSDTSVPLHQIDSATVRQTLSVFVQGKRYVCIGISKSRRNLYGRKKRGAAAVFGIEQVDAHTIGGVQPKGVRYESWVETRIEVLARDAKEAVRSHRIEPLPAVVRDWAWPEIIAMVVLGGAFLVSLFL